MQEYISATAHYIIRKQILDIHHDRKENAYAKQTEMSNLYRKEVIPVLEKVCREICPGDRLVRIDRLVVELPALSGSNYKATWAEEIEKAFRKSLLKAVAEAGSHQQEHVTVLSREEADLQFLAAFLRNGTISWSYPESHGRSLETLFRELIKKQTVAVRRLLREGLRQEAFAKRLCCQFPASLLDELFPVLHPDHAEDIRKCYDALYSCFEKAGYVNEEDHTAFLLRYQSLRQLVAQARWDEKPFLEEVLRHISQAWNITYPELLHTISPVVRQTRTNPTLTLLKVLQEKIPADSEKASVRPQEPKVRTAAQEQFRQLLWEIEEIIAGAEQEKEDLKTCLEQCILLSEKLPPVEREGCKNLIAGLTSLLLKVESHNGISGEDHKRFNLFLKKLSKDLRPEAKAKEIPHKQQLQEQTFYGEKENPAENDISEAVYIQNAGLVIVWPFFTQLFEALNFTEKQQFISKEKQYRAVHLLQYLIHEEEECYEYRLPLNKLLCGMSLPEPVPRQLTLTKEEKEAAKDLIKAAIRHWPLMKNTSVEGFREAFLGREGKLSWGGKGWLLQVEQKSYDMIINKLPWAISLVKLPWMPEPLFVEW